MSRSGPKSDCSIWAVRSSIRLCVRRVSTPDDDLPWVRSARFRVAGNKLIVTTREPLNHPIAMLGVQLGCENPVRRDYPILLQPRWAKRRRLPSKPPRPSLWAPRQRRRRGRARPAPPPPRRSTLRRQCRRPPAARDRAGRTTRRRSVRCPRAQTAWILSGAEAGLAPLPHEPAALEPAQRRRGGRHPAGLAPGTADPRRDR